MVIENHSPELNHESITDHDISHRDQSESSVNVSLLDKKSPPVVMKDLDQSPPIPKFDQFRAEAIPVQFNLITPDKALTEVEGSNVISKVQQVQIQNWQNIMKNVNQLNFQQMGQGDIQN